jgi:hypothetical protein
VQADRRQAHFVLPQTLAHFRSRIDEALMDEFWLFRTSILTSMGAAFCSIPHESYSL